MSTSLTIIQRFHKSYKINKVTGCWDWQQSTCKKGYGYFSIKGKTVKAHRVSYLFLVGRIRKPFICHSCDNTSCVNPKHLFNGTRSDNMKDCYNKGRGAFQVHKNTFVKKGNSHKDAKLSYKKAAWIRKNFDRNNPELTLKALANKFKVSTKAIWQVVKGKTWNR